MPTLLCPMPSASSCSVNRRCARADRRGKVPRAGRQDHHAAATFTAGRTTRTRCRPGRKPQDVERFGTAMAELGYQASQTSPESPVPDRRRLRRLEGKEPDGSGLLHLSLVLEPPQYREPRRRPAAHGAASTT